MSYVTSGKGAFTSLLMKWVQGHLFQLDQLWLQGEAVLWKAQCCGKPGRYDFNDDGLGVSPSKHAGAKATSYRVSIKKPWPSKAGQREAGASWGGTEALSKQ